IVPKVFNAIGRTRALVWLSVVTLVTNAVLDVVFGFFWQHVGIALATSVTYTTTTVVMLVLARRYLRSLRQSEQDKRLSAALQYGGGRSPPEVPHRRALVRPRSRRRCHTAARQEERHPGAATS